MEHRAEHPQKFINHKVADTLDSSNAFEGPEKLLELWFDGPQPLTNGLLDVPVKVWESMLDLVHCKILSFVKCDAFCAYVLSESSFFLYPNRLVLKTCGTTTLLEGIDRIIEIVQLHTNLYPQPSSVYYSHRGFLFPEKQMFPHRSWDDEVETLKKRFPHGKPLTFGDGRNPESWHLFVAVDDHDRRCHNKLSSMEIMMTGLDEQLTNRFYLSGDRSCELPPSMSQSGLSPPGTAAAATATGTAAASDELSPSSSIASLSTLASTVGADPDDDDPGHLWGNVMTRKAFLDKIYPTEQQIVDSFAFTPCGYSCNGIVDAKDYFTVHVTPENGFSYASFETNVPPGNHGVSYKDVVARVLAIFRPSRFTLIVYDGFAPTVDNYRVTHEDSHRLGKGELSFQVLERL